MKKTIIALMALSGLALGGVETLTLDFGNTLPADSTEGPLLFTDWEGIKFDGSQTDNLSYVTDGVGATNLVGNFLLNNDNKYVQYSFTLQNNTTEEIILSNISFGVFAASAGGGVQGSDRTGVYNLTVGETTYGPQSLTLGLGGAIATASFDFSEITIDAGDSVEVSLNWKRTGGQYYTGLANMSVTAVVPEPTTATLSLLALAGLAARRRRK